MFHFSTYIGSYWPLVWMHVLDIFITLYPTMQIGTFIYILIWIKVQFFLMLEAYHKLNMYDIAYEFKINMVEACHKFNLYDIANRFKIFIVVVNHKFHIKILFYQ
jgi:hypothetical protein